MGKLPGNLSLQELEGLALEELTFKEEPIEQDKILLFLSTFDLSAGTHKISKHLLLRLYKAWTGKDEDLNSMTFTKRLNKYLESHRHWILLSKNSGQVGHLLQHQESKRRTKLVWYLSSFEAFCKAREVRPGDFWIEGFVLYHMYDFWRARGKNKKRQMSISTMCRVAKLVLESKEVTGSGACFRVSESIKRHISDMQLCELREGWKRRHERRKSKKSEE